MKILKTLFGWIFEKQSLVVKGGVRVVTPNPPPDPNPPKKWGTAIPRI